MIQAPIRVRAPPSPGYRRIGSRGSAFQPGPRLGAVHSSGTSASRAAHPAVGLVPAGPAQKSGVSTRTGRTVADPET